MLPSLRHWQPQTILRFIQAFSTSAATVRVATDQGDGYLKALGNTTGPHVLACEWVATNLARTFGLPTLDFSLISITEEDEIPLHNGNLAQFGRAFITRAEENIMWGGSAEELRNLVNPQDLSRLVIFDTWTLNCDRHHPDENRRRPHYDNVFLSTENVSANHVLLKTIDHTHCFTCGRDLTSRTADIDFIQDESIYGLFPAFASYLQPEDVSRALRDLGSVNRPSVEAIVQAIPNEWQVDQPSRQALIELIVRRAGFMTDNAEGIMNQIFLPNN
jgi:hypothetical protein